MITVTVEHRCDADGCESSHVESGPGQKVAPAGWFIHEGKLYCPKHEVKTTVAIVERRDLPDLSRVEPGPGVGKV